MADPVIPQDPFLITGAMVSVAVDLPGATGPEMLYCSSGSFTRTVAVIEAGNSRSGCFAVRAPGMRAGTLSLELKVFAKDPGPILEVGDFLLIVVNTSGGTCVPAGMVGRILTVPGMVSQLVDSWQFDGEYTASVEVATSGQWLVEAEGDVIP